MDPIRSCSETHRWTVKAAHVDVKIAVRGPQRGKLERTETVERRFKARSGGEANGRG